ncbi:exodeoxyribonuclease V subunit alpha [Nocardioides sp.]|uniref:exodeoxyribonuclease V subunit alpha n=1 Tax=Nocardioides sp. TaxID=35761 RepID=UPI002732FE12|nr:exodeoxyribonuclease V subunit alpha [Nocardioides sp.]MDP3890548.1 exodeoxyribonuclease V subunit alpha [Nocardioides sp.]
MTEIFEAVDAADHRLALTATGRLRDLNTAGVITAADVHVAQRLAALTGDTETDVLVAIALATRAVRHGSVCLDLRTVGAIAPELPWPDPESWGATMAASRSVAAGVLRWEHDLLYLDRYRAQERQVCADLGTRAAQPPPQVDRATLDAGIARIFGHPSYAEQGAASRLAATRWTSVITGGPGTGKTTTVAGLLALLVEQAEPTGRPLRIALAAPTGKAAARLQEAVAGASLPSDVDRARVQALTATTLHRLLGTRRDNATRFRHHRANRLPHDVVVVDESSMVSLTMMARLVEAVRPDARLVLVGDRHQLASIDAGAVLADLVGGFEGIPDSPVAELRTTHRFGSAIGRLAEAIRTGDADAAMAALRQGGPEVELVETEDAVAALRPRLVASALAVRAAAEAGDATAALAAMDRHRLLCAHRRGPYGVQTWNDRTERWLAEETGQGIWSPWYAGRPVLVTANDHGLGLYNGDTGVAVRTSEGELRVWVPGAAGVRDLAATRLSDVETMHAMTIHKSQGSQAEEVTVLMPDVDSRLLTRELFYTAVTRAQRLVRVVGTEESVRAAVAREAQRASGLRQRLNSDQRA